MVMMITLKSFLIAHARLLSFLIIIGLVLVSAGVFIDHRIGAVSFKDPALRAEIYSLTYIDENEDRSNKIYRGELERLQKLQLGGQGINDLSGIEYCRNLDELGIYDNPITDLSPLSKLKKLKSLSLRNNPVTDLTPLSRLKALTTLVANGIKTNDLSPLRPLTHLSSLQMRNNQITGLEPLASMTDLEWVDLSENRITGIEPLSGMTKLTLLSLSNNKIKDLRGLADFYSLKDLRLDHNEISDLSPLASLKGQIKIDLGNNSVSDLGPITGINHLWEINLSNNRIVEVSPLSDLNQRGVYPELINLSHNQIQDASPVANLKSSLHLYWRCIHRFGVMPSPTAKGACQRFYGEDGSIISLADVDYFELVIDLSYNRIEDLDGLARSMPDFSKLEINGSQIGSGIELDLTGNPLNPKAISEDIKLLRQKGIIIKFP
jgi:Leucine-rich repeat (LRR) protein